MKDKFYIGDFIKIKENLNSLTWYSDETYQILDFNYGGDIAILDRELPVDGIGIKQKRIHIENIEIDYIYYRRLKILKLKENVQSR